MEAAPTKRFITGHHGEIERLLLPLLPKSSTGGQCFSGVDDDRYELVFGISFLGGLRGYH